jgi:hypothetical protein
MPDTSRPLKPGAHRLSIVVDCEFELESSGRKNWLTEVIAQASRGMLSNIITALDTVDAQSFSISASIQLDGEPNYFAKRASRRKR